MQFYLNKILFLPQEALTPTNNNTVTEHIREPMIADAAEVNDFAKEPGENRTKRRTGGIEEMLALFDTCSYNVYIMEYSIEYYDIKLTGPSTCFQ